MRVCTAALGISRALLCLGLLTRGAAAENASVPGDRAAFRGYTLSLEAREHFASRSDFTGPLLLFQQRVDHVSVSELQARVRFELALGSSLRLELTLPFSFRRANVRFRSLEVSAAQALPAVWREISGFGLADPTLVARYRALQLGRLGFELTAGARLPQDDNPGSAVVPTQLPLSTGQAQASLGAGAVWRGPSLELGLAYQLGYAPRSSVAYLVRRIGNQGLASGALGDGFEHRTRLELALCSERLVSLALIPEWTLREMPTVVEREQERAVASKRAFHELTLEARLRTRISRRHALDLVLKESFLKSWDEDPLFPLVIPERGFGISWKVWGS